MGKLVVDMFTTLDGVVQAPGGPREDTSGGFQHGGWQGPFFDDASGAVMAKGFATFDALLLGRKTYDIFAAYWPKQPKNAFSGQLNSVPKYVASRTLKKLEWRNSQLIEGDVAQAVPKLTQKHKEVRVIGSANLVQTLLKHDLVDRFNLWVYPIVLGSGKRLFGDGAVPARLKLVEATSFAGGAVHLVYEAAGKPTYVDMTTQTLKTD
ncbi:MAG: dihydrofolate reductase family protein [bacterium]